MVQNRCFGFIDYSKQVFLRVSLVLTMLSFFGVLLADARQEVASSIVKAFNEGGSATAIARFEQIANEEMQRGGEGLTISARELERLWVQAYGDQPLELYLPAKVIAHFNTRLERRGLYFMKLTQSKTAAFHEAVYTFLNASLKHQKQEAFDALVVSAGAAGALSEERKTITVDSSELSDKDLAELNAKAKAMTTTSRYQFERNEHEQQFNAPLDLFRAGTADQRKFNWTANGRLAAGVGMGVVAGPTMDIASGGSVSPSQLASGATFAAWEYQFAKEIPLGKSRYLGPNFWSRMMARFGQVVPLGLNLGIPLTATLVGALVSALAGSDIGHSWGDTVYHPIANFITFGLLSFGFVQTRWSEQVALGYLKRFTQFAFETISLVLLGTMKFVAGAGAFAAGAAVLWAPDIFGNTMEFKIQHAVGYGTHLLFALAISTGLAALHGFKIPFTNVQVWPSLWETQDKMARAKRFGDEKPGICARAVAWLGERYTWGWGRR